MLRLLVARGEREGPVLVLLGAVHGDEYEGPQSLWQTFEDLEPARLRGTVVMLPVANSPAYAAGLRTNPQDPKDLARTFPGSADGSVTEQIAHHVATALIARADFLFDLHSAGRYYRIDPWTGYQMVSDPAVLDRQRQAARVLGYPTVWGTPYLPGRTLSMAAERKIPALYCESPGEGRARLPDIQRNLRAIRQLQRFLGMLDEPLEPLAPERVVENTRTGAGYLQIQIVCRNGGFFHPTVSLTDSVEKDSTFGRILDPTGQTIESVPAPCAGRVVFLRTFPIVQPGDSLGTILEA